MKYKAITLIITILILGYYLAQIKINGSHTKSGHSVELVDSDSGTYESEPQTLVPEKPDEQSYQVDWEQADVDNRREQYKKISRLQENLKKIELGPDKLRDIRESLDNMPNIVVKTDHRVQINTLNEAFTHLNTSIGMAYIPENYYEDGDYFLFSGGTTAGRVVDFSTGLAVSKADSSITGW